MSEEHTDNLKKARARLIEQRRAFVKVLAGPYERGKTEQARERFLDMQTAIEAMNRAIEDEERSQGSVHAPWAMGQMKWRAACLPPWRAEKFSGGYVVRDANGFAVAYVYGRSTEDEAMAAKQMTMDEARRIASNIAKLPEMLKRGEFAWEQQASWLMRSRRTCCRRKVCPFWLARPASERFCSDRGRTSGHCTSKGRLGSKLGFVGDAPRDRIPLHSSHRPLMK
jgi:hypothetical protein